MISRRFGPEWLNSPATFRNMGKAGMIGCCSLLLMLGCSPGRHYNPGHSFSREALTHDYTLLRKILESKHPSLYWFTSKDSMDQYFDAGLRRIEDSMTENRFAWQVLAPVISKIRCGHTSIKASKGYDAWSKGRKLPSFPLLLRIWNDSMVVTGNLNKKDSFFKKGLLIISINGKNGREITKDMMNHLPADGQANNINYLRISSNFPYFHRNVYGVSDNYEIVYKDSLGKEGKASIPLYKIPDSVTGKGDATSWRMRKTARLSRSEKLKRLRNLKTDSTEKLAIMTVNTFMKGRLHGFFNRSFRELKKKNTEYLIIDLRSNGGGRISASTLLTRYISRKSFRIADSAYAITGSVSPYARHIKGGNWNSLAMHLISKKKKDGKHHLTQLEKKEILPKRKNHFDGKVFILTNGPTFSASTLFCNIVKEQPGIILAGEETGGGWHGNNGVLIPDITLPETKIRVRLPLFRIVQYNHVEKTGSGIIPDIIIPPGYEALMKGIDRKMETVKELINSELNKQNQDSIKN